MLSQSDFSCTKEVSEQRVSHTAEVRLQKNAASVVPAQSVLRPPSPCIPRKRGEMEWQRNVLMALPSEVASSH